MDPPTLKDFSEEGCLMTTRILKIHKYSRRPSGSGQVNMEARELHAGKGKSISFQRLERQDGSSRERSSREALIPFI